MVTPDFRRLSRPRRGANIGAALVGLASIGAGKWLEAKGTFNGPLDLPSFMLFVLIGAVVGGVIGFVVGAVSSLWADH